ncbi:MAG: N-acetyltransferase [Chitinophagia bacterium]|nr:N-acetyltransferase [Chitinophagia bacterium]
MLLFDDLETGQLVGVSSHVRWGAEPTGQRFILAVAVALPPRRLKTSSGQAVAHHVLTGTLLDISDSEEGLVLVTSIVDIRNEPSRRLLATCGFREASPVSVTDTMIDVVRTTQTR